MERQARTLAGDETDLYRLYATELQRAVARRVGASRQVIEDACAFAWAQLLAKQPDRDAVMGWLIVVARHEALRLIRLEQRELRLDGDPAKCEKDDYVTGAERLAAPGSLDAEVEARELLERLTFLPERRRRIVELRLAGYCYSEITEATGDGQRAIDRQLKKARHALAGKRGPNWRR